jgi:hypothetical protein
MPNGLRRRLAYARDCSANEETRRQGDKETRRQGDKDNLRLLIDYVDS